MVIRPAGALWGMERDELCELEAAAVPEGAGVADACGDCGD